MHSDAKDGNGEASGSKHEESRQANLKYLENYLEIDLEPRATLLARTSEDLTIFASHYSCQVLLRKDLANKLLGMFRDTPALERDVVEKWMELGNKVERMFISKFKLDYFEIDSY